MITDSQVCRVSEDARLGSPAAVTSCRYVEAFKELLCRPVSIPLLCTEQIKSSEKDLIIGSEGYALPIKLAKKPTSFVPMSCCILLFHKGIQVFRMEEGFKMTVKTSLVCFYQSSWLDLCAFHPSHPNTQVAGCTLRINSQFVSIVAKRGKNPPPFILAIIAHI